MILPDSAMQYKSQVDSLPTTIAMTLDCHDGIKAARQYLRSAKRIFFTGSGSSIPAALLGMQLLIKYTQKAAIFAPSSLLLDDIGLEDSDVVVLISQGWNRADAALITRKVLATRAHLLVITGRPEREANYVSNGQVRPIVIPIFPTIEKIFCRPASVVTSYVKIVQLLEDLTGITYKPEQWQAAYLRGLAAPVFDISTDKQYVVLTTGYLLCAGNNIALSIREGAGRYGVLYEIESYGHGIYVPDQIHKANTQYIVLTNSDDTHCLRAVRRIIPMLQATQSNYALWHTDGDPILCNVELMGRIAQSVLASVESDGWDMNRPQGMEENRSFHEILE